MKNILLVDDSATSRMLFKAYMPKGHTFIVHEAKDLEGALKLAVETQPDLVVLDYNLPEKSGIDIGKELRLLNLNMKMVLLTSNTQQAIIEEALTAGITQVFEKPITPELIATLLQESIQ